MLDRAICLDNGTVSITPRPVAEALEAELRDILHRGPPHIVRPAEEYPRRERTLERIAAFCGTSHRQIALMRGVSEAYQTVLRGIDWAPGDELVITEDEEAALLLPALHLRDSYGVCVHQLRHADAVEDPRAALEAMLSPRTRLVALSHVTTTFGYRYPVVELCAVAREHDVTSFLDLGHSAGLMPYRLDDLGCDFAGVLSYKWMYAPYASGLLYVREGSIARIALRFAGGRSEIGLDLDTDEYELHHDARKFQYGPWSWPIVHAWATALDYIEDVGRDQVWERTQRLAARLRERLEPIPGVRLLTPPPEHAAALVTFEIGGLGPDEAAARVADDDRVRVKAVPGVPGRLRASMAIYTDDGDVDLLGAAVERVAAGVRV